MNLLPQSDASKIIPELDRELLSKYADSFKSVETVNLDNLLPYWVRKRALDEQLESYELGRALYHLAHRRGFLSNRKSPQKADEELGKVKAGINELKQQITDSGSRTLGEFFAGLNPHERRIRSRWTHRDMYREEFDAIWQTQQQYMPEVLNEKQYSELYNAFFHQRPLKSAKHLVGKCELEPSCRRAPWATLEAQEFRMLQMLNNCQLITEDGEVKNFSDSQRTKLIEALEIQGDLKFSDAKKLLGLKRTAHFTLENGGESRFVGNRVNARMLQIFSQDWQTFDDAKKEQIINDLRCYQNPAALAERAKAIYGLPAAKAEEFADIELEGSYCNISRKAIRKFLPLLREGMTFPEAKKKLYPQKFQAVEPKNSIIPLAKHIDLRNPVVSRVLTELRKVVNNIVLKYGKPGIIRVELARDMKNNAVKKKALTKRNRDNERVRKAAAEKIAKETIVKNPRRDDILKLQLAEECNWTCPYTGRHFGMNDLFGGSPTIDIEHIIPFSRSLDDSYLNKTLCDAEYNRNVKKNMAPGEYLSPDSEAWNKIIGSVSRFKGDRDTIAEKLRRFKLSAAEIEEQLVEFSSSQLNDTRYASKVAADYLGTLYGGVNDAQGKRRIQATRGGTTAFLREMWKLNNILGDGVKNRGDHRHHAIDAIAVALTTPATIKTLSDAAVRECDRRTHKGRFKMPAMPWDNFWQDTKDAIDKIVVSHRVKRGINGQLHDTTNYAPVKIMGEKGKPVFHVRRQLAGLKSTEVEQIVNPVIRQAVKDKLDSLGISDPAKAFTDFANHPFVTAKSGKTIHIHKVRISVSASPQAIASGPRERFCNTASNHHMEVFAVLDKDGNEIRWDAVVVSMLEAKQRLKALYKQKHKDKNFKIGSIVNRNHGPNTKFKFSISPGDTLQFENPSEKMPTLVHLKCVPFSQQLMFTSLNDARLQKESKAAKEWFSSKVDPLRKLKPQKVMVLPLGEVIPAND